MSGFVEKLFMLPLISFLENSPNKFINSTRSHDRISKIYFHVFIDPS